MLYTSTVEESTLRLLTNLCGEERLKAFNLVGGTALSLQLGHRKSIDLDLFSTEGFDAEEMRSYLTSTYGFKTLFHGRNSLTGEIDGVKIDIITYPYVLLDDVIVEHDIRLCSCRDIAAMKLSAITQNGTRLKDFVDVAYLSTVMSFEVMLEAYETKYAGSNRLSPMKAITYFDDIDFSQSIVMADGSLNWRAIANRLTEMTEKPDRIFGREP